jgi:hypothetical protein
VCSHLDGTPSDQEAIEATWNELMHAVDVLPAALP